MQGYLKKEIQNPMAQGRPTQSSRCSGFGPVSCQQTDLSLTFSLWNAGVVYYLTTSSGGAAAATAGNSSQPLALSPKLYAVSPKPYAISLRELPQRPQAPFFNSKL